MGDVRNFGAAGDGQTDDSDAILHAIADGDGYVTFPRGVYRISRTIEIDLDRMGPVALNGSGGTARVIMAGPGPAFRLVGTHGGTGDPTSMQPRVRSVQRMPTVQNIVIEGAHEEADGLELQGTVQAIVEGVLIREVRNGIRLFERNRNVLITHCHIYRNHGVGIFMDQLNLHQIIIIGCHISYNRLGGIRIERSEIRNLQITGNDIEYNNHRVFEREPEPTAEIHIDTTAERSSVAEVTIASNTIQATPSPGGANIRILGGGGDAAFAPSLWAITGNIIGNQEVNVHLRDCYDILLTGNTIYSCTERNLLLENSKMITIGSNSFRRHSPRLFTGVRLVGCQDTTIQGCSFHDEEPQGQTTGASLLELEDCRRVQIGGCQFMNGAPYGIDVNGSSQVGIVGCTVTETRETPVAQAGIRFAGEGKDNLVINNILSYPGGRPLDIAETAGVSTTAGNVGV